MRPKSRSVNCFSKLGIEYTHQPEKEQQWAKKLIDAGADIILGDQAHWVQSFDSIKGKHVSYGLGNYILINTGLRIQQRASSKHLFFINKKKSQLIPFLLSCSKAERSHRSQRHQTDIGMF